jgi:hypothetical protein
MVEKQRQYITILLAVIIIIAVGVFIITNLPKYFDNQQNSSNNDNQRNDTIPYNGTYLTIYYNEMQTKYTLKELQDLEIITGYGGKRTNFPSIKEQGRYTGVVVTSLVEEIAGSISNYSLNVGANEEGIFENQTFNYSVIQGNVNIYNASNASEIIDKGGVTMILCYQSNGELLDKTENGRLMIAFINNVEEKITPAFLWWKFVESIEIKLELEN